MDVREKLDVLGRAAQYDDCTATGNDVIAGRRGLFHDRVDDARVGPDILPCVSHYLTPTGGRKAFLKVLQTSACQNNCYYCAFRAGRDVRRAHLGPDELARSFDLMYRSGLVDGIFLSSGVIGTNRTMDEMLATTELIRGKYAFRGYIHLKLLPGVQEAHVARAVELADRVSANLEGPTPQRLAALAPLKDMAELVGPLRLAARMRREYRARAGSQPNSDRPAGPAEWGNMRLGSSTQFVVGPAGESDLELLSTAQMLYREAGVVRSYYSAFTPLRDTPLEGMQPTHPAREHRLYQADWLLRYYGFSADELPFDDAGLLQADTDPKTAWARRHPERFPVEVNRAPLADLLRVPGIGPHTARAILATRRQGLLREIGDLRKLGARAEQAAPYVALAGRRPPYQPELPLP